MIKDELKKKGVRKSEKVESNPKMVPFEDLEREVFNSNNEHLGRVEDIIIDLESQRIAFGILSFGGIFGLGEKRYAIPWKALKYRKESGTFLLDIDKEKLETAESFEPNKYPYPQYGPWAGALYGYWGYRPYWPI